LSSTTKLDFETKWRTNQLSEFWDVTEGRRLLASPRLGTTLAMRALPERDGKFVVAPEQHCGLKQGDADARGGWPEQGDGGAVRRAVRRGLEKSSMRPGSCG